MKKRIALVACATFLLVLVSQPALADWPEDYGSCMQTNFNTWGGLYDTRMASEDWCVEHLFDLDYPYPSLAACQGHAHTVWWDAQSNSNSIFGNCVAQININYNDLDFCAHSLGVYNDCFSTFQCEAIEDEDARILCVEARWTCETGSGIDRCR
jgi:hypothetical protein